MDRNARLGGVSLAILLAVTAGAIGAEGQSCGTQAITCGQTINGQTGPGSCTDPKGGLYDAYTFDGVKGEEVTATISSPTPNLTILVGMGFGPVAGFDSGAAPVAVGATQAGTSQFSVTLDETSSDFFFAVAGGTPGFKFAAASGPYTLSVSCSGLTSCKVGPETLCLENGRFEVQATYAASTGEKGQAQTVFLSDDTGFLWFYSPTNVEAVVKVIDGCSLGGHYWFFAGGLTNSRVVLTVTDTKTNTVKKYTNPENAAFEPIQDTSAFATCP
jgi:hypothetical protein